MNDIYDLIQAEYEKDNYKIEYNNCKNGLAYIYCSSNALYEKDNLQSFEDKIIKEDRYEWSNLRADCKPEIEIFIRDIWLSWYVKGINSRVNSYDKLIDFIRSITKGYTVRCIGASSGGFIGSILAIELNAEISYSFAGQFSLSHHFDHLKQNPYLKEYCTSGEKKYIEYYTRIPDSSTNIFYMFPNRSKQDQEQYELVKTMNQLHTVKIDIDEHGVAIYPFALPKYLSYNLHEIEKLAGGGSMSKMNASIKIGGWSNFIRWATKKILKMIKR